MAGLGPGSSTDSRTIRFGVFEVDLAAGEVRRRGLKVRLQEKPFQILVALLGRPGGLVTREELRQRLWAGDTYVDFDHNLNIAIAKLRTALGDEAGVPRYIETLPRRGYRFIAAVERNGPLTEAALNSAGVAVEGASKADTAPRAFLRAGWRLLSAATVLAVLLLAYLWVRSVPPPRITGIRQLTNDGLGKSVGMATDGARVYFMEYTPQGGRLAAVSIKGGEVTSISQPIPVRLILGISPSHTELLVTLASKELPAPPAAELWALPILAGQPHRIGNLLVKWAIWSPDGTKIAYLSPAIEGIFLANADGSQSHEIVRRSGTIHELTWSPDGRLLRFTLLMFHTDAYGSGFWGTAIWEVGADGSNPHPAISGDFHPAADYSGQWTPDGKYFVFDTQEERSVTDIWAIREENRLFSLRRPKPVRLSTGPVSFSQPHVSPDGRTIFTLGQKGRGELVRYDSRLGQFVTYLGGLSANWVSFSNDARWIAYISYPENTLWRSRPDGRGAVQLTFAPMEADGLYWSPDGKQIALRARQPGKPWEIYLVPTAGGSPQPLIETGQDQGIATWSPDGKRLVFGHVPAVFGVVTDREVIHMYDLGTRRLSALPGSHGLWTSRWSPDGRFIAALTVKYPDKPLPARLVLFDLVTKRWRELGAGYVNNPTWSRDSHYIYYDTLDHPAIRRVRIADGRVERVTSLTGMRRAGPNWCGLTPDDSPILLRDEGGEEIYALDWEAP